MPLHSSLAIKGDCLEKKKKEKEIKKDTTDKVFFLDLAEAQKYFYVNNERACDSTPYARQQGAYVYSGASWWWLRSPGANRKFAADIHISGAVFPLGDFGISFLHGVRPVIWACLD